MILTKLLIDLLGISKERILLNANGCRKNETHAWLQIDNWIVDITADQFADSPPELLCTTSRQWHDTFLNQDLFSYDSYMNMNKHYHDEFAEVCKLVLFQMHD